VPEQVELAQAFPLPLSIGVIADTHIWENGKRVLPADVIQLFRRAGVDLVLHAGDINDSSVLNQLETIAPVLAVKGNNDDAELQEALPLKLRFKAGNHTIGLVHGHEGRSARAVAFDAFPAETDLVVYGHSHLPNIEKHGRTIYFNPGSPTDRRWNPHFGVGILRCTESGIDPHLFLFTRPQDLENVTIPWLS